jgi:hypothetical protein
MDEVTRRTLNLILEVKSVAFATVNNGEPDVRIANVMLVEEHGLYLPTARANFFMGSFPVDGRSPFAVWMKALSPPALLETSDDVRPGDDG